MTSALPCQDAPAAQPAPFCDAAQRRLVLIVAIAASAMGFIDGSVVAIAIPAIRDSLDASLGAAQWINNAYMLTLSALILVGGAAGDRFGLRAVFGGGILIFTVASLFCAVAPGANALIAARALQGLGAALMVPGSLAIIAKAYPPEDRGRAIGTWAAASALTTAAGPILGGALLGLGGAEAWRLIFALNLPLGALCVWLLWRRVPPDPPAGGGRLDLAGAALATLGLGLVAWGLTGSGGEGSVPEPARILTYATAGALVLGAFLAVEARVTGPMVPLGLFRSRAFSAANAVTFLLYFALSAVLFYLPMVLIGGWGRSEAEVGAIFLPLTLAVAGLSGPMGTLADRVGPAPLIALGCAVVGVAYAWLGLGIGARAYWGHVLPAMSLMGLGMALVVAPLSAAVMAAVSEQQTGAASGINNAVSRVAGLVAVAAMGGVAAASYAALAPDGPGFGVHGAGADHIAASDAAFRAVALITAVLSLAAAGMAWLGLRPNSAIRQP